MSFGITGIDHVQITVPRPLEAECLAFYRNVLGLEEIEKPAAQRGRGGAWFRLPHLQLHIGLDAGISPPSRRHVGFRVNELDVARARALAAGLVVEESEVDNGTRRFFIRDPAGNRIELSQG
jgi:catechol 2,3-dioxygenase-like lactoylglutathione lyase family enzyme